MRKARKDSPLRQIDDGIAAQKAIISYRQSVLDTYLERDAVFAKELSVIQLQRSALARDYESAGSAIETCQRKLIQLGGMRSALTLRGSGPQISLSPEERKMRRLKTALATIKQLESEGYTLEDEDTEDTEEATG